MNREMMRGPASRPALLALLAVVVAGELGAVAGAQDRLAPHPAYQVALRDAVTADNPTRPAGQGGRDCPSAHACYVPDPNPEPTAGLPVDSYTADVYERPTRAGGGALVPAVDIASHQVGSDVAWFYFRINLAGPVAAVAGDRPSYGFELDFDDDPAGEVLVLVGGPGRLGPRFSAGGVTAYWNRNSNILGPNAQLPDGPGAAEDGYEVVAVMDGDNKVMGEPGGPRPLLARLAREDTAVELAIPRSFLEATKHNERGVDVSGEVNEIGLRPLASVAEVDPRGFSRHDRLGRKETGSPFPYLRVAPPSPAACPESDNGQSTELLAALDTGTADDTGIPNPCYPSGAVAAAYDNSYYVSTTFSPPEPAGDEPLRGGDTVADDSPSGDGTLVPVLVLVATAIAGAAAVAMLSRRRTLRRLGSSAPD